MRRPPKRSDAGKAAKARSGTAEIALDVLYKALAEAGKVPPPVSTYAGYRDMSGRALASALLRRDDR